MSDLEFSCTQGKDKILVYRNGRLCSTFRGTQAERIRRVVENADGQLQLLLAKLTGNYKRGNEQNTGRNKL